MISSSTAPNIHQSRGHLDYVILFAATGEEAAAHGNRKKITAFLVIWGIRA